MALHLKIQKSQAQVALTLLRKADAVDEKYQVQKDEEFVYVPIRQKYIVSEISVPAVGVVEMEPVESKAKSLPRSAGGAFDLIGDLAVTKIRKRDVAMSQAEALISTHPNIKAVYLDRGITGPHRLRDLELLKGIPVYETKYRENGINFEFDISKVYFSPRLATERMLVAKESADGEFIIDMFSGIGAFALNIAKIRKVDITAIDNNPDAIFYMKMCIEMNSLKGNITPVCGDAAEVIRELPRADRIIMNLPHESYRYIEAAISRLKKGGILHFYEILDIQALETRMEQLRSLGFVILKKREVHGYSSTLSMYSLTLAKAWE